MSKLKQTKIPVQLEDLAEAFDFQPKYRLVRERDGLIKQSEDIMWLEFGEDKYFKSRHEEPAIGRSLLMSPFNNFFTWQCTPITKIIEQNDTYVKFHTENSIYELFKIN